MSLLKSLRQNLRERFLTRNSPQDIFSEYARSNKWGDKDSLSGKGSNLETTSELRKLLKELGAKSMVDVPCGDFFWMAQVDLGEIEYLGRDIAPSLIERNAQEHRRKGRRFEVVDLITGPVPKGDVLFVRDCLVHLSNEHISQALTNIANSGRTWLLSTTFPQIDENLDILTGQWRALDLTKPPFNLPAPETFIVEGNGHLKGQTSDKTLGLWPVSALAALKAS
jgi:hypothetical protein